jgi:ABC-2 type transport system permease protein
MCEIWGAIMNSRRISDTLRITSAIAIKDIGDALRNKTILTIFVLMAFITVMLKLVSNLWESGPIDIVVYDEGSSQLASALDGSPEYRLYPSTSIQDFEELMNDGDSGKLGLVITSDYDQALDSGSPLELSGFVLWQFRNSAANLEEEYEEQLTDLLGSAVSIEIKGTVFHEPESMGAMRLASLTLVMALFYIGMFTVPHLMMEEKQTKTLDTLLISPATFPQLVLGKALAGLFFVITTTLVVLVVQVPFVVQWGITLLALFGGALLAVGLGLLMGLYFETKQMMNTWTMILAQPLLIPVFFSMVDPIFPETLRSINAWVPTVALSLLFRYSFSSGATEAQVLTSLAVVLVSAMLVLALVVWKVRRLDR